ncbi:uncharacterized protein Pyn_06658 [Prunus yedoensis var. nudiflora]|uniref:Uncharacterized protein n=1 Tax=Prunus yedoensis var. nudiflora TaxID=2094558 RepID=A0A314XKA0_PRUYE|nr:uncharacterized protein Pyn_06658 [Prunus yedoensis var. nudiflora]
MSTKTQQTTCRLLTATNDFVFNQQLIPRASENPSEDFGFGAELGFKEKRENLFDLEAKPSDAAKKKGIDPSKEGNASLGSNFLQSEGGLGDESKVQRLMRA